MTGDRVTMEVEARCTWRSSEDRGSMALCYPGTTVHEGERKLGEVATTVAGGIQITISLPDGETEVWLVSPADLWTALGRALGEAVSSPGEAPTVAG